MRLLLRSLFEHIDNVFDAAFTPAANPLLQLGAMGWFFYWIVAASGIYLYIFFDTGVIEAYQSVELITHAQWYAGGIMRSFHRYASDALVVVVFLHLLREYAMDRFHPPRAFSWITGVLLLWFLYASGISGYWIVWDRFAQYIAIVTTEWLDTLPFFGEPIARNFLHETTLSGRFFTLFVFIHIAVPLFMLFFMWIHIQRLSLPDVNPPKILALGSLGGLLVLSLAFPALSQGPADLARVPAVINLDWFYVFFYPLLDHLPGALVWAAIAVITAVLVFLPWLLPDRHDSREVAVVDLANCNGCARCVQDCPYSAVTLRARTDALPYHDEASVDPELCVSCGICTGACPTATPFRRRSALAPGIELPDHTMAELRSKVMAMFTDRQGTNRVIVFGCATGPDLSTLNTGNIGTLTLPCIGMLPPSFLDFILSRGHADGVLLTGCREEHCMHRFGIRWTEMRIARQRDPMLRSRVDRSRLACCWAGISGLYRIQHALAQLQEDLTPIKKRPGFRRQNPCLN